MKSKYAVLAIIGVILLSIVIFFVLNSMNEPMPEQAPPVDDFVPMARDENQTGVGSLADLQNLGESLECRITYEDQQQGTQVSGTYFVADNSVRADFLTFSPDLSEQVLSSMIIVGNDMYVWSEIEDESYGIKTVVNAPSVTGMDSVEPVPLTEDVQYECRPWDSIDRTVFVPPSEVRFQDLGALLDRGMEQPLLYEVE